MEKEIEGFKQELETSASDDNSDRDEEEGSVNKFCEGVQLE